MPSVIAQRRLGRSKSLNYVEIIQKTLKHSNEENCPVDKEIRGFLNVQINSEWISLFKKPPWISLYCILDENRFTVRKSRDFEKMLQVDLQNVKSFKIFKKKRKTKKFSKVQFTLNLIELKTCEKTVRLKFENDQEMNRWLNFLLKNMNKISIMKFPKIDRKKQSEERTHALKKSKTLSFSIIKKRKKLTSKLVIEEKHLADGQQNFEQDYIVTESAKKFFSIRTNFSPEIIRRRPQCETQQFEPDVDNNSSKKSTEIKETVYLNETFVDSKRSSVADDPNCSENSSPKFSVPLYPINWTKSNKNKSIMITKKNKKQSPKRSTTSSRNESLMMIGKNKEKVLLFSDESERTHEKVQLVSDETEKHPSVLSKINLTEEFTEYLNSIFNPQNENMRTLTVIKPWLDNSEGNGDKKNSDFDEISLTNFSHPQETGDGDKFNSSIFLNPPALGGDLVQDTLSTFGVSTPKETKNLQNQFHMCSHYVSSDEESASKLFNSSPKVLDIASLCKSYQKNLSLEGIKEKENKVLNVSSLKKRLNFPCENSQTSSIDAEISKYNSKNIEHTSLSRNVNLPVISCSICRKK